MESQHKKRLYVLDQESHNFNKLRSDELSKGKQIWEVPRQFFWFLQNYDEDNDSSDEEEEEEEKDEKPKMNLDFFIEKEKEIIKKKEMKKENETANDSVQEIQAQLKYLQQV